MVANGRVHPALEPMMRIQEAAGEEKKRNSDCQHLGWQKRKGLCKMKHQRCIVGIPQRNAILPSCTPRTEHTNKLFHVKDFCLVVNASSAKNFWPSQKRRASLCGARKASRPKARSQKDFKVPPFYSLSFFPIHVQKKFLQVVQVRRHLPRHSSAARFLLGPSSFLLVCDLVASSSVLHEPSPSLSSRAFALHAQHERISKVT